MNAVPTRNGPWLKRLQASKDAVRRLGGTPEEVLAEPELLAPLLPPLRADFEACESDLAGWRAETRSAFETRVVAGGQFFLASAREELVALVAASLRPEPPP